MRKSVWERPITETPIFLPISPVIMHIRYASCKGTSQREHKTNETSKICGKTDHNMLIFQEGVIRREVNEKQRPASEKQKYWKRRWQA
jgi:hypothetical protein